MAGGTGTGILAFGTGAFETSVDIPGLTGILTTDHAEAFFMYEDTTISNPPGNDADNHLEASATYVLSCSVPVAGTGFTVRALARGMPSIQLYGNYKFRFVWSS